MLTYDMKIFILGVHSHLSIHMSLLQASLALIFQAFFLPGCFLAGYVIHYCLQVCTCSNFRTLFL